MQMTLNPKQQKFVDEYLVDLNAKQAAIRAGYSERTAEQQGSRLLSNVKVSAAIREAKAERSERTKIDADWVLARLAQEAEADVADLYDDSGAIKPVREWPKIWRQGLVTGLDIDETSVDGVKYGEVSKIKLSDRIRRIELIGKHVDIRAFAERMEHTGKDGGPIKTEVDLSQLTDEQLQSLAGILAVAGGSRSGD